MAKGTDGSTAYKGQRCPMRSEHEREAGFQRYVSEFAGRHNIRDLDTIKQMEDVVAGLVGRRLLYRDLIADKRYVSGGGLVGSSPCSIRNPPSGRPEDRRTAPSTTGTASTGCRSGTTGRWT